MNGLTEVIVWEIGGNPSGEVILHVGPVRRVVKDTYMNELDSPKMADFRRRKRQCLRDNEPGLVVGIEFIKNRERK
jgi:hypothetical protein